MDNLRPERDELDQFRDRSAKQVVKPKASSAQPAPVVAERARSGNPLALYGLMLLLLISIGALAWMYMQQRDLVQQIRAEQEEAAGFIGQSKLLLARLEGQVSETGAELQQAGSATDQKLAFLDSEVRKLWAIANDRNKKAIEANEQALTKLAERVGQLEQQGKAQLADVKDIKQLQSSLTERLDKVAVQSKDVADSLNGFSNRVTELASNSVAALSEVETLSQELQELKGLKSLQAKVKEMDRDLASVDASRQQLVQRVVDLERRLNQHQFKPGAGNLQLEQPIKN